MSAIMAALIEGDDADKFLDRKLEALAREVELIRIRTRTHLDYDLRPLHNRMAAVEEAYQIRAALTIATHRAAAHRETA